MDSGKQTLAGAWEKYVLISCEGFDAPSVGKYEEDDIGGTFYLSEDVPCEDFGIVVEAWRPLPV